MVRPAKVCIYGVEERRVVQVGASGWTRRWFLVGIFRLRKDAERVANDEDMGETRIIRYAFNRVVKGFGHDPHRPLPVQRSIGPRDHARRKKRNPSHPWMT